jgi:hypothetical protein
MINEENTLFKYIKSAQYVPYEGYNPHHDGYELVAEKRFQRRHQNDDQRE